MSAPLLFALMNSLESIGTRLPLTHRLLLLVLADAANALGQAWLSADRIALRAGTTRRTVENCLPELATAGWIEAQGKRHRVIVYAVTGIDWEERIGEDGRRELVVNGIPGRAIVLARGESKSERRSEKRAATPNVIQSEVRTAFGDGADESDRDSGVVDGKSEPGSVTSEGGSRKSERHSSSTEPHSDNPILDPLRDPLKGTEREDSGFASSAHASVDPSLGSTAEPLALEVSSSKAAAGGGKGRRSLTLPLAGINAPEPRNDVEEVFAEYLAGRRKQVGATRPPVLDDKRKRLIAARLKVFSLEELKLAARGAWLDDWHVTQGHNTLEQVFRDAAGVERFMGFARRAAASGGAATFNQAFGAEPNSQPLPFRLPNPKPRVTGDPS